MFFVTSCLCGKAFTLIEMVVAITLLVIIIVFSGMIFKSGIGSYRTATAQAEIMQKLRAITEQLNSDFKGLRKDAPLFIWFRQDPNDANQRFDQIMFFADGDFQAIKPTQPPLASNLARIFYGQARGPDPKTGLSMDPCDLPVNKRLLTRRQHLSVPILSPFFPVFDSTGALIINTVDNNNLEYDNISLSQWQAALQVSSNCDQLIPICMPNNPPYINFASATGWYMLMAEGVGSFAIQWSYPSTLLSQPILWWPSNDPDSDPTTTSSDFEDMLTNQFGFCFNAAKPSYLVWFLYDKATGPYYPTTNKPIFPHALKFTFTLYDKNGVFKDGQTFTHIVYLDD